MEIGIHGPALSRASAGYPVAQGSTKWSTTVGITRMRDRGGESSPVLFRDSGRMVLGGLTEWLPDASIGNAGEHSQNETRASWEADR